MKHLVLLLSLMKNPIKTRFEPVLLLITAFSMGSNAIAAGQTNPGYLLISIDKMSYSSDSTKPPQNSEQKQNYKVLLDANFLAQFKNPQTQNSSGTEFYCFVSDGGSFATPGIGYTQWFAPKSDGKIMTWLWTEGSETVDDKSISAHNAVATTTINFPSWQTLDSNESLSFVNNYDGVNVGVGMKYVPSGDPSLTDALVAPVTTADGSILSTGDSQTNKTLTANCSFQNN